MLFQQRITCFFLHSPFIALSNLPFTNTHFPVTMQIITWSGKVMLHSRRSFEGFKSGKQALANWSWTKKNYPHHARQKRKWQRICVFNWIKVLKWKGQWLLHCSTYLWFENTTGSGHTAEQCYRELCYWSNLILKGVIWLPYIISNTFAISHKKNIQCSIQEGKMVKSYQVNMYLFPSFTCCSSSSAVICTNSLTMAFSNRRAS